MQKWQFDNQINHNPAGRAAAGVVADLQQAGYEAWLVGGGVRDLLLGRTPKDFDVATSATPDILRKLLPKSNMVGAKFGVFIVPRDGHSVEVATFREEGEYHDRRRPDLVRFSTLENDAHRRDFTANALYYDPINKQMRDLVGGLDDINARKLRTVGEASARFQEDALRVLRGIRFAANLEFEIEDATWDALMAAVPLTREISIERVRDEILNGLTGGHPGRFLELLDASGLVDIFLPEVTHLKGCAQPPEFHPEGDVFTHTKLLLENLKPDPSPELAMAVLLHDIAKPATQTFEDRIRFNGHDKVGAMMAETICRRLRMSNSQILSIKTMIRRHMQFMNLSKMRKSTLKKFMAEPTIDEELELHRVDCLASHGGLGTYELALQQLQTLRAEAEAGSQLPSPWINGHDLINLGMKPGVDFSRILQEVYDAQLEGEIENREQALELAARARTGSSLRSSGEEPPPHARINNDSKRK